MKNIVCFGEVLWDMLPTGKKLGGAPLNVALRAQSFGNQTSVISSIGNDKQGEEILRKMRAFKADFSHLQVSNHFATSEVLVSLNERGSASYEIKMPCAWDDIKLMEKDVECVKGSDAFIYGSLIARGEKSRNTLFELLKHAPFKVFDVNLRPPHYDMPTLLKLMEASDFIKLNDDELFEICGHMGFENRAIEECVKFLATKTNTDRICVTRGKHGAILFINNQFINHKGYKITVADTVGAGDSFLASLISKLLNGASPAEALDFACAVGAIVASKSGANPMVSMAEIEDMMES
ncbi:carbohydrate kinase family protein [Thermophagus sp. OGC60D27]|uniref:carbohydrate kinase family protein n=1 Tax=Thermophagus sp. OGC60D27 TaxID=3458415 RepID=UPI0040379CB4